LNLFSATATYRTASGTEAKTMELMTTIGGLLLVNGCVALTLWVGTLLIGENDADPG
jgi:hypothetical protein